MKKKLFPLLAIACLGLLQACDGAATLSGTTAPSFYVDSVAGDDAASGSSPAAPWKTLAKVAAGPIPDGSTVYLKRGSLWNESLALTVAGIRIDAYGAGAAPLLDGYRNVTGWVSQGGGIYSAAMTLATGEALGNLAKVSGVVSFLPWKTDMAGTFSGAANETYSYDWNADTLYLKSATVPSDGLYRASTLLKGVSVDNLSGISVNNIAITGMSLHGIELKNCTDCSVSGVSITATGGAVIGPGSGPETWLYAGNGIEYGQSSSGGSVTNAAVSDIFDSCFTVQTYSSTMSAANFTVADSQFGNCGFAGVELSVLSNGGSTGSLLQNVALSGLQITNAGKGWSGRRYGSEGHGVRVKADSGAGAISGVSLLRSDISGSAGDGVYLRGKTNVVQVHRLRAHHNDGVGINVAEAVDPNIALSMDSSVIDNNAGNGVVYFASTGFRIQHTTFHDNGAINLSDQSLGSGPFDLRNNVFSTSGANAALAHIYIANGIGARILNYNCYTEKTAMIGVGVTAYNSVLAFSSATSQELFGVGVVGSPLLDPANGDFSLLALSSCAGSGDVSVTVTEDYLGNPFAATPSRGAVESVP